MSRTTSTLATAQQAVNTHPLSAELVSVPLRASTWEAR